MTNKTAFYFPFIHVNQYVDISKKSIADCGYDVKNFKQLFSVKNLLNRRHNAVVLNWYEDRLYQKRFGPVRAFVEHFIVLFQLIFMRCFTSNIIWVRHNFKPHNRVKRPMTHKLTCAALKRLAKTIVTLEKTESFSSSVVPHPLYRDDEEMTKNISSDSETDNKVEYLFFGTIKPYKRLHDLLMLWPQHKPLKIVGYCQEPEYLEKIKAIVVSRNLNIDWQNEYVSDEYLNQLLTNTAYVFMPHSDGAMISSGTFYQAINFGVNIVCFDSFFARDKKAKHNFVHIVSEEHFEQDIENLVAVPKSVVMAEAMTWYGRSTITQAWRKLLNSSN
tara:strand:+ start:144 stop:1136 length:993 start_codon:yes stop_codon:yes gene_type:complete